MRSGSSRFSSRPEASCNGETLSVPAADRRALIRRHLHTRVTNPPSTITQFYRSFSCGTNWGWLRNWKYPARLLASNITVFMIHVLTVVVSNLGRLSRVEEDNDFFRITWGVVQGVKWLVEGRTTGNLFPAVTSIPVLWLKTYSWSSSVVNRSHHLVLMAGMLVNHICCVAWSCLLHQQIFIW